MLLDPCAAPLLPGLHGTEAGYLQRVKAVVPLYKTLTPSSSVPYTCGYIVWCPRYHSPGFGPTKPGPGGTTLYPQMNCFLWQGVNATDVPYNTTLQGANANNPNVFGLQRPNATDSWNSTIAIPDPASEFVGGAMCRDARLLSSCIRLTFVGRQTISAGIICPIRNMPLTAFLANADGVTDPPSPTPGDLSVARLFQLSSHQTRIGTEVHEIRSRDSDNELDEWITIDEPVAGPGSGVDPLQASYIRSDVDPAEPMCYGFAWQGVVPTEFQNMYIELYKNFEWRPKQSSGISLPEENRISAVSNVPKAIQYLDRVKHGWDLMAPHTNGLMSLAAMIQSANYGGAAVQIGGGIASIGAAMGR